MSPAAVEDTRPGELPIGDAPSHAIPESVPRSRGSIEPCRPSVYNVRFPATVAFKDKLERFAEVLGVHDAQGQLAEVLETAIDLALEKKDPAKRQERREARAKKRSAENAETHVEKPRGDATHDVTQDATQHAPGGERSRHVPAELRDQLLVGADHRCEYVAAGGTRCAARTGLHIDHKHPFSRGGPTTEQNLRVLCALHNYWEAERHYGVRFVKGKIAASRARQRV
ncbi:MAG: HNH endonuclease [bacterium]|nr:HNH endonuclease [bacterium]